MGTDPMKDSAEKPSVHLSRMSVLGESKERTAARFKSVDIFRSTELAEL
jgi:hypothetical protein